MAGGNKGATSNILGSLVERMKTDKKFELAVYAVLILIGVLIFAFSSCDGSGLISGTGGAAENRASSQDEVESRLADILSSMEGAGAVKVMIVREEGGEIRGAIVTAEGAADIAVRIRLQNAVKTVLGIELNQVEIFEMETNNTEG